MAKKKIDIQKIIGEIYFKIATWHNDTEDFLPDENKSRLYVVSYQILKKILSEIGMDLIEEETLEGPNGEKKVKTSNLTKEKEIDNAVDKSQDDGLKKIEELQKQIEELANSFKQNKK